MAQANRPLSPHLQIFRWYFTMAMSIVHRATGIVLTIGLLFLAWWLLALANGPEAYGTVRAAMDNILGGLVLFGFTLAFFLKAATGLRHLIWDFGFAIEKHVAHQTAVLAVVVAVALTLLTWLAILIVG